MIPSLRPSQRRNILTSIVLLPAKGLNPICAFARSNGMARATENDVALGVLRIAAARPDGLCTFNRARAELPNLVNFNAADRAPSATRPGEPMWHQLIRNIRSHYDSDGNFIERGLLEHVSGRGYRATAAGRAYLKRKGF